MKRAILLASCISLVAVAAHAQHKPASGERTLEVNFAPLGGTPVSIGGIKYRSFSSETSAFRLGLFLGYGSTSTVTQDEDSDNDAVELKDKKSTFNISLQPGIEKHFAGTDRLSPYIGGVLSIGYGMTNEREEVQVPDEEVGATITKGGSLDLGLNAIAGFDFYVAEKLYLGTEIGFGLAMHSDLKKKVTHDNIEDAEDSESKVNNKSTFNLGPNVVGQLRLGWVF
jgi:opacity protein-like surface antigen